MTSQAAASKPSLCRNFARSANEQTGAPCMPRRIAFALFRQHFARPCSGLREQSGLPAEAIPRRSSSGCARPVRPGSPGV